MIHTSSEHAMSSPMVSFTGHAALREEAHQVELDRGCLGRIRCRVGGGLEERHCPSMMSTRRSRAQLGSSVPVASIAPRDDESVFDLSMPC